MRIVFMGTPDFAATILDTIVSEHEVAAVFTRPDAVRGRGKKLEPTPVKMIAEKHSIPVYETCTLRDADIQTELKAYEPDVICVAAYGAILPQEVLDMPKYGCFNVHASLLPRWRGAAPIERAILAGDTEAGVCIMRMELGLDTGAYCVSRCVSIDNTPAEELTDSLACLGAHALLDALGHVEHGLDTWVEQDESCVTYADKIQKGELDLSPEDGVAVLSRKVQASSAAHPARVIIAERSLTVLRLEVIDDQKILDMVGDINPLQVCFVAKRLFLGACDGVVEVITLKPDGKQAMEAKAFAAGIQGIKSGMFTWGSLNG